MFSHEATLTTGTTILHEGRPRILFVEIRDTLLVKRYVTSFTTSSLGVIKGQHKVTATTQRVVRVLSKLSHDFRRN